MRAENGGPIFGELLAQERFVRALATSLVRPEAVDDVVQETWLAAWRAPRRAAVVPRAWLASTVRNIAAKLARGGARRNEREERAAHPERQDGADDSVARLELGRRVVEAVLALDEPYRTAIVLRYYEELGPEAIAQRLGLPLETVRARLRRARERLRARLAHLEDPHGKRGLAALAMFAAPSQAWPWTGWVAGAGIVKLKIGVAAAVVVIAGLAWQHWGARRDGVEEAVAGQEASSDGAPVSALTETLATPLDRSDGPVVAHEDTGRSVAVPADGRLAPGLLVLGAEAFAGFQPPSVDVRVMSETRFAQFSVGREGSACLTPGTYMGSLHAPGFEPRGFGPFEVRQGETCELGRLALAAGSSRIEGRVTAEGATAARKLSVELSGIGRHPCSECAEGRDEAGEKIEIDPWTRAEICAACGYSSACTRRDLELGQEFAFAGLALGRYRLTLRDPDVRAHPIVREVQLERSRAWCAFDLPDARVVELALEDLLGRQFTGAWRTLADQSEDRERIEITVRRPGEEALRWRFGLENTWYLSFALGSGMSLHELQPTLAELRLLVKLRDQSLQPIDRERHPDDTLFPDAAAADLDDGEASVGFDAEGRIALLGLPLEPLWIDVRCGPWKGSALLQPDEHSLTVVVEGNARAIEPLPLENDRRFGMRSSQVLIGSDLGKLSSGGTFELRMALEGAAFEAEQLSRSVEVLLEGKPDER